MKKNNQVPRHVTLNIRLGDQKLGGPEAHPECARVILHLEDDDASARLFRLAVQ